MVKKSVASGKPRPPRLDIFVSRISTWSRRWRIIVAGLVASIMMIIVGYLGIEIFYANATTTTNFTPYVLLIAGLGVGLNALGWFLLGCMDIDPEPPWQATRASAYFVLAGVAGFFILVLGLLGGLAFGYVL